MTRYERRVLAVDENGGFDVDGRVVEVLDSPKAGRSQVTALVEVPETEDQQTTPTTFAGDGDDSEGVDVFYCGEPKSDDTSCERKVDGPDDTCWQHPKE